MDHIITYKEHYGPIPVDEEGRTYDVHHKDGNHANNAPENLEALTIKQHYDIHYAQGDWGACLAIAMRMNIPIETISELSSKTQQKRIKDGTHQFLSENFRKEQSIRQKEIQKRKVASGIHHFLGGELQRKLSQRKLKEGTHNFQEQLKNGVHPTQIIKTCPHCGKTTNIGNLHQYHFNNCKRRNI